MENINWSDLSISIINWLDDYGILTGLIGAAAAALGALCKRLWDKTGGAHFNDKIKKEVAELCVQYVEQVFKHLHGSEKFEKAIEAATEMLADKGINITELELRVYIEAAVAQFNEAFKKTKAAEPISWEDEETEEAPLLTGEVEVEVEDLNPAEAAG